MLYQGFLCSNYNIFYDLFFRQTASIQQIRYVLFNVNMRYRMQAITNKRV